MASLAVKKRAASRDAVAESFAQYARRRSYAATPDEDEVAELTWWINTYLAKPWTDDSVAAYREHDLATAGQRKALDAAATILRDDLNQWEETLAHACSGDFIDEPLAALAADKIGRLRAAIETLDEPRGWFESGAPRLGDARKVKAYTITAKQLASEGLIALQAAQRRGGKTVQQGLGGCDGTLMRVVYFWLTQIYGPGLLPTRVSIHDSIKDFFGKSIIL